jgi:ribosome-binding factor A
MNESNRQLKFSRLIQKELSELLARDISFSGSPMVTVSIVRSSPDLGVCKVYVSVFPDKLQHRTITWLEENHREVRLKLAQRIRHQVKAIPDLLFFLDDTITYSENINKVIEEALKKDSETHGEG